MASVEAREVVVVTGAGAGLGRAIAREFAAQGAALGLISRDRDRLEAARVEVESLGGSALVLPLDVADADALAGAGKRVERELGPIDVWVNNAMTSVFSPVREMTPEEYRRVTDVTYLGYVYGTLAALRQMRPRNRGSIVQVSSALAYRSIPLQSAYCAAKHAIKGFTESLRCELIHDHSNIHVSMVHMPALNTPQFNWVKSRLPRKAQPVPPIFEPEVGARAVYWAAHHRRRDLYVGGSTLQAVFGNMLFPRLLDHYLARTGFDAQQFDGERPADQPDNLWLPVPGDYAAQGGFTSRAKGESRQLWLSTHVPPVVAVAAVLGALGLALKSR